MDLTREHRNATIARANERASQTVEDEEETGGGKEDTADDGAETGSPNTQLNIAYETNPIRSTLIEDEDPDESETSPDELAVDCMRQSAKDSSSKSRPSHRRKHITGNPAVDEAVA